MAGVVVEKLEKNSYVFDFDWINRHLGKNHKKIDISLRVIARTNLLTTNNEGKIFQPSINVHLAEEKNLLYYERKRACTVKIQY